MIRDTRISLKSEEPMCALDPLLLIPRIEYVEDILSWIGSRQKGYTLVILDMKNFHLINDVFSYNTGDIVLADFILLLRSKLPKDSISLRFRHGDEFLFFVPLSIVTANELFSRFNIYCEQYSFLKKPDGNNFVISFRFAVLELTRLNTDFQKVLYDAELKLREVKGQGTLRDIS